MTAYPLVSRDPADQPGVFVADPPVSGRSQPRPAPVPADFRHRMTFWVARYADIPRPIIVAECIPCDNWRRELDGGHDLPDLINLYAQHAGLEAAKTLCIDTLAKLGASDLQPMPVLGLPVIAVQAAPSGAECAKCGATENLHQLVNPSTHVMETYCELVGPCYDRHAAAAAVNA
jgi:hypothetical protein